MYLVVNIIVLVMHVHRKIKCFDRFYDHQHQGSSTGILRIKRTATIYRV